MPVKYLKKDNKNINKLKVNQQNNIIFGKFSLTT